MHLQEILLYIFIAAVIIQLGYCGGFTFARLRKKSKERSSSPIPVSVVICARNEEVNLRRFLPEVLEQEYPSELFEVVVVNDGSEDNTETVLSVLQKRYGHLKTVSIPPGTPKDLPGKKYALKEGIRAARHERLLFTDADCRPASRRWLKTMAAINADVVLGYGAYERRNGLLNSFIRWETAHTCMQYTSYALAGKAYMGVGRNLLYKKSLSELANNDPVFRRVYRNTPSGDDDLLISKVAARADVAVCLDEGAATISLPKTNWKAWWHQKTRHISTGKYYRSPIRNLLGIYALSHGLCWLLGLILLAAGWINNGYSSVAPPITATVFTLLMLRVCSYWINAIGWYRLLGEKKLWLFYPLGDLGWALYNVFLSPYIFWKNKLSWK